MKFEELQFKPTVSAYYEGIHAIAKFPNGYGASVVRNKISYGSEQGLYELCVLKCDDICYGTPISRDVIGWLDPAGVENLLNQIESLSPA